MAEAAARHEVTDLKYRVLALLSMAAKEGQGRVPLLRFYELFEALARKFPDIFPDLAFVRSAQSVYSKRLDAALQEWIGYGIDVPNPRLQFLEIAPNTATLCLRRLEERFGERMLAELQPAADHLIGQLKKIEAA